MLKATKPANVKNHIKQAIIVIRYLLSVQLIGLIDSLRIFVNVKGRANMDRT